jgi:hypothetical protein
MRKGTLSLALILIAAALAYPQQVSFKLAGGLSWINGNDFNAALPGEYNLIKASSLTTSGAFKNLTSGPHFQAELITHISGHIAIGLGGGYYRISNQGAVANSGQTADGPYNATTTFAPQVSVIPFFVNLHYFADLAPKIKLDVYAGPVFSIIQTHIEHPQTSTVLSTSISEVFTASSTALGGQAGLGLSYQLTRHISLIVDGNYHFGKTTDLIGNWVQNVNSNTGFTSSSSDSYYLWTYDYTQGSAYSRIGFFDVNGPAGAGISNAKKAAIDVSGIQLSAGVRISF